MFDRELLIQEGADNHSAAEDRGQHCTRHARRVQCAIPQSDDYAEATSKALILHLISSVRNW